MTMREAAAPQSLTLGPEVIVVPWPTPVEVDAGAEESRGVRPPGVGEIWNLAALGSVAMAPPVELAPVTPDWAAEGRIPGSILDCCVRVPGGDILWPETFAELWDVLAPSLAVMAAGDPSAADEAYLYLTVDRRYVLPGETGRRGGWHLDGLQGQRYTDAPMRVCHQLLLYDRVPTLFALQAFKTDTLDVAHDNVFAALGRQVLEPSVRQWPAHTPLWTSAYHVHASAPAREPGWRHFVRLEISRKQADRAGNTVHPRLSAGWDWQPRPIPTHLR